MKTAGAVGLALSRTNARRKGSSMPRAPIRLACPACLGVAMASSTLMNGGTVDHCRRCGGTWLLRRHIDRLRAMPANALRVMIHRADDAGFLCHGCHVPMNRDAASCPACGWKNRLECPDCLAPMRHQSGNGVTVDVCRECQGVWLDHHELSAALWTAVAATAALQSPGGTDSAVAAFGDASSLLDVLWYMPDLASGVMRGAGDMAGMGLEAASHAPGVLSSLPEAAGGALELVGELAGAVFELIAAILGGIFEGLSGL